MSTYTRDENEIIAKLKNFNKETGKFIYDAANKLSVNEIVTRFNKLFLKSFKFVSTTKMIFYKNIFKDAIKKNQLNIIKHLECYILYFEEIYKENKHILELIKEKEVGNFGYVIEEFEKIFRSNDKFRNHIILMTFYVHIYFYRTVIDVTNLQNNN